MAAECEITNSDYSALTFTETINSESSRANPIIMLCVQPIYYNYSAGLLLLYLRVVC